METLLFSIDPERMCLVVNDQVPENDLQRLREQFPKHKICVCCSNHAPLGGAIMVSIGQGGVQFVPPLYLLASH
jgi:hypothetical protein